MRCMARNSGDEISTASKKKNLIPNVCGLVMIFVKGVRIFVSLSHIFALPTLLRASSAAASQFNKACVSCWNLDGVSRQNYILVDQYKIQIRPDWHACFRSSDAKVPCAGFTGARVACQLL